MQHRVKLHSFDDNRQWAYSSGRRAPYTDWLKGSLRADDNPSLPTEKQRKGKAGCHAPQEAIRVPQTEELTNSKEQYQWSMAISAYMDLIYTTELYDT